MSHSVIYSRKSSEAEDRQILSIESQSNELSRLADQHRVEHVEVLSEARSAKEPGRPVFNQMMQRIYRGDVKTILCWRLDRLARNSVDGGAIIWAIKQHGLEIITPTQTFRQSDDNTILLYIEFGMAQKFVDDLSRNVKRGLRAKVERGWYPGIAPLGYLNNRLKDKGEKDLIKDPERFPLIRRMWDLMLTGEHTPPSILKLANRDWGFRTRQMRRVGARPLARSAIYRILTDPFYAGRFEYPRGSGLWYAGRHEPMVTEEEYERVQMLLGRTGRLRQPTSPRPRPVFPFTGLIRCGGCAAAVTAEEKHQLICDRCRKKFAYRNRERCPRCQTSVERMAAPTLLHYTYYHCTGRRNPDCNEPSISAAALEIQIDAYLSRIEISDYFRDWMIEYIHELHEQETSTRNHVLQSQQRAYQDCLERLDSLVRLKTAPANVDGHLLSEEEYSRQRSTLVREKGRLDELLHDTSHRVDHWLDLAEKAFVFASSARSWFAEGDATVRRAILSAIGSNLTLTGKKLTIEAQKPFLVLENGLPAASAVPAAIEPKKCRIPKRQRPPRGGRRPLRLRGRDDVRTYEVMKTLVLEVVTCMEAYEPFSAPLLKVVELHASDSNVAKAA